MLLPHVDELLATGFALDVASKEYATRFLFPAIGVVNPCEVSHFVKIEQHIVPIPVVCRYGPTFGNLWQWKEVVDIARVVGPTQ